MAKLIVSRHAAAVEFIRQEMPEFADAKIMDSVAADDVRGNVVAGNLPLHLAALCSQVIAVEFAGAPPRGAEYSAQDMRAAGAKLARYTVQAIKEPEKEIHYSNQLGSRGRRTRLIVGKGETIVSWDGNPVPGVAVAKSSDYTKNGKWSHTKYTIALANGAWSCVVGQSWEEGAYFHNCNSVSEAVAVLRKVGCDASDAACEAFIRKEFPNACARMDAKAASLATIS